MDLLKIAQRNILFKCKILLIYTSNFNLNMTFEKLKLNELLMSISDFRFYNLEAKKLLIE